MTGLCHMLVLVSLELLSFRCCFVFVSLFFLFMLVFLTHPTLFSSYFSKFLSLAFCFFLLSFVGFCLVFSLVFFSGIFLNLLSFLLVLSLCFIFSLSFFVLWSCKALKNHEFPFPFSCAVCLVCLSCAVVLVLSAFFLYFFTCPLFFSCLVI